jgi:hypothetical protein
MYYRNCCGIGDGCLMWSVYDASDVVFAHGVYKHGQ